MDIVFFLLEKRLLCDLVLFVLFVAKFYLLKNSKFCFSKNTNLQVVSQAADLKVDKEPASSRGSLVSRGR